MRLSLPRRRFLVMGAGALGSVLLAACAAPAPTATPVPAKPAAPAPAAPPPAAPAPKPEPTKPAAVAAPAPTKPAAPTNTAVPAPAPTKPAAAPAVAPTNTPRPSLTVQGKGKTDLLWQMSASDFWIAGTAKVLPDFADKNPNVGKVTLQPTPDDWINKLVASMVAGTAPDVFDMWGDIMPPFVERGQVVDVEPYVKRDMKPEDIKDFYDWQWRDFVMPWLNNIRFGMPRYVNIMFTWYRKDHFDEVGQKYPTLDWTHDDYANAARKLTKKEGSKTTRYGLLYPAWGWDRYWYKPVIWGGGTVDPKDNTRAIFGEEKALAAFEWTRKLMWDEQVMLQPLDIQRQSSVLHFPTGKFSMNEEGIYPFEMDNGIQGKFPWAYAHTPKGPTGQRKVLGTTDGYSMWKGSKNLDQAWDLVKWAVGPTNQLEVVVKAAGRVPIRHSILKLWEAEVVKARPALKDVNLKVAVEAMEMGYPSGREFFKDNVSAQQLIVPALEKMFVTGGTPTSYLKEVAEQVTKAQKTGSR
ncbi:MAG: sugar ABC transporter substrate-binding protein [Chloroflexota bacterium]|nr:MAG: sugar ABC transporter substrate-binding protein [Chloroflexota bacterium]